MSEIRSYQPSDFKAIQRIHEDSGLDYKLPNMNRLLVNKVLEIDGIPRAALGMSPCVENFLWIDKSSWADAESKWLAIKALDKEATEAISNLGVESIFCCIPPGFERFGRRIQELGYNKIRSDWSVYAKSAGVRQ